MKSNPQPFIFIDADTVVNGDAHGRHFPIDAHQFGDSNTSFGTSAIKISPSAIDFQIGAPNQFVGQFSSTIVDESGTAATPGYPSTSTTSPSAVLPNGTTSTGQPTLWHATIGISYNCSGINVQGFNMSDVWIEGVRTGVYIRHGNECPDGTILNCGVQFRNFGFDVGNISKWRFIGNHFRAEWGTIVTEQTSYDMRSAPMIAAVAWRSCIGTPSYSRKP
jgi:hypothetical protein